MSAGTTSADTQELQGHEPDRRSAGPYSKRTRWQAALPLTAICTVQAMLSLTLVWSNTAFGDEADYLWLGRLVIAHWLHGTTWPSSYGEGVLSGSPVIYPPIGALANSIGGLGGARILYLAFMLGATVLLYRTASQLIGPTGAAIACAIWAISEPVLRLAFATYDPLSVFLTALSAWLVISAARRKKARGILATASAAAAVLALANATAYSGIVIDPVVITFAFLIWRPTLGIRIASLATALLISALALSFGLLMTLSHSWAGLMFTVISRNGSDRQSVPLVLNDIWGYSGLIICLATVGAIIAIAVEPKADAALITLLAITAFVVPVAQLHDHTGWSLDKHLAYGIWFAAISAGYAISKLLRLFARGRQRTATVCGAFALAFLAVGSLSSAWQRFHAWPNATSFVAKLAPTVAGSHGLIYASGQQHIAEYYTPQGNDWTRWATTLSLNPRSPRKEWNSYYTTQLQSGNYGVIALVYATTFSSHGLPGGILVNPDVSGVYRELLDLVGANSGQPGLSALTVALENDKAYELMASGPYDSGVPYNGYQYGIYAIWQKKGQT